MPSADWLHSHGCSTNPEGVDDDYIGVLLNYACAAVLAGLAVHLWHHHGWQRARIGIFTESFMVSKDVKLF
jgi:hypothetical protein